MDTYHPNGTTVTLTDVFQGRPKAIVEMQVVEDGPLQTVLWLAAGNRFSLPADSAGNLVKDIFEFDHLIELRWNLPGSPGQLVIMPAGASYSTILRFFEPAWDAPEWYINLQTPFVRTSVGFESTDLILDVVVNRADCTVRWKDEPEFEAAVQRGFLLRGEADEVRRSAEAAIALACKGSSPFDETWASWRPPAERLTANG